MKYVKLPVVVDAWEVETLLRSATYDWDMLPSEVVAAYVKGDIEFFNHKLGIHVNTIEGDHFIKEPGYLVRGIEGEFYGCKKEIFENSHRELVEE